MKTLKNGAALGVAVLGLNGCAKTFVDPSAIFIRAVRSSDDAADDDAGFVVENEPERDRALEIIPTYDDKAFKEVELSDGIDADEEQIVRRYSAQVFITLGKRLRVYPELDVDDPDLPAQESGALHFLRGTATPNTASDEQRQEVAAVAATSIRTRFKPSANYGARSPGEPGAVWMGDLVVRCNDARGATANTGSLVIWWRIAPNLRSCRRGPWRWIPTKVVTTHPVTGARVERALVTTKRVEISGVAELAAQMHGTSKVATQWTNPAEANVYWSRVKYAREQLPPITVIDPALSSEDKLGMCLLSGLVGAVTGPLLAEEVLAAGYSAGAAGAADLIGGSLIGSLSTGSDVTSGLVASAAGAVVGGGFLGFAVATAVCLAI